MKKKNLIKMKEIKKKANKLKQLKMFIKNKKNTFECSYKDNDILNNENIINTNYSKALQEQKRIKELNMMCLE